MPVLRALFNTNVHKNTAHLTMPVGRHAKHVELFDRKVSRYVSACGFGFDISNSTSQVNVLESALLLGYPLDLAGSFTSLYRLEWRVIGPS